MDGDNGWESLGTANKCCRIGGKLREVKRKAKIGEKIKIVDAFFPLGSYKNGDVLTVLRVLGGEENDEHRVCVEEFEQPFILTSEYVVLEVEKETRFKVGDKARGTAAGNYAVTDEEMTKATVMEIFGDDLMRIRIDEHTDTSEIGCEYMVFGEYFKPAPFTLSDLKPCMVVKIRDGQLFLVSQLESGLGLVKEREGKSLYFGDFNDDLTFKPNSNLDIIEVYGYRKDYLISSLELSSVKRELLWKREEPKPKRKMTIDEICKELGEDIEIVKGE